MDQLFVDLYKANKAPMMDPADRRSLLIWGVFLAVAIPVAIAAFVSLSR